MYCFCCFVFFSYGTSTANFVTYVTIRGTMNYAHIKASVFAYFSYLLIFVFVVTQNFIKIYQMLIL